MAVKSISISLAHDDIQIGPNEESILFVFGGLFNFMLSLLIEFYLPNSGVSLFLPLNELALIFFISPLSQHIADIVIDFLLGIEIVKSCYHFIVFYVEFRQIKVLLIFFKHQALLQTFLKLFLQPAVDWMLEQLIPVNPSVGFVFQHSLKNVFNLWRQGIGKPNCFFIYFFDKVDKIIGFERDFPKDHLIEGHSK